MGAEYFGAIFLVIGFTMRCISIPLMVTMVVTAVTVHWDNGRLAVAEPNAQLEAGRSLLKEHGNCEWLTDTGNFVILNNDIEFATTISLCYRLIFHGSRQIFQSRLLDSKKVYGFIRGNGHAN